MKRLQLSPACLADGAHLAAGREDGAHAAPFVARLYRDGTLDTAFGGVGSGVFTWPIEFPKGVTP